MEVRTPKIDLASALAVVLCAAAAVVYIAVFGVGAAIEADTAGYRQFLLFRSLGYPIVLWIADHSGLAPYLGLVQLVLLCCGLFALWKTIYQRMSPTGSWVVLALSLGNFELVKFAFRQAPEAAFTAALAWYLAALIDVFSERRSAIWALIVSGTAIILLRPAGLPLLIGAALAMAAYAAPALAARFAIGVLAVGWLVPSVANGITRGFFAPQIYGGFFAVTPISHAVLTSPDHRLPPPLDAWGVRLAPLRAIYDHPAWPFDASLMQELASTYETQALNSELATVESQTADALHAASERGRNALSAVLRARPWSFLSAVSANAIGLLAAPGFIDAASKGTILRQLSNEAVENKLLVKEMDMAVISQRVIPVWLLQMLRWSGLTLAFMALWSGIRLWLDLFIRIAGRGSPDGKHVPRYMMRAIGAMICGYLLMAGLVSAIPRFTLVITPLLALFLVTLVLRLAEGRHP